MTETTTLQTLQTSAVAKPNDDAPMSLMTGAGFRQLQRVATALSSSTMVPVQYRAFTEVKEFGKVTGYLDNPAGLPNCVVALNMAVRMNADPLMIMQNLHVIEGRPSWSSQFIIAMLNSSGKFSPLRFELGEPGEEETIEYTVNVWKSGSKSVEKRKATFRHQSCVAWVIEKETGERLQSPTVTMAMARDEGWIGKNGSKWQTMQEVMLQYRTAALLGRFYAPELLMGLQSREEVEDFIDAKPDASGEYSVDINDLRNRAAEAPAIVPEDPADTDAEFEHVTRTIRHKDGQVITTNDGSDPFEGLDDPDDWTEDGIENINKQTGEITQKTEPKKRTPKPKPEPVADPEPEVDPAENVKPSTRKLPTFE